MPLTAVDVVTYWWGLAWAVHSFCTRLFEIGAEQKKDMPARFKFLNHFFYAKQRQSNSCAVVAKCICSEESTSALRGASDTKPW